MTEKEIIKQLKELKSLGANSAWKETNRNLLLSQLKGQSTASSHIAASQKIWYGFKSMMPASIKNFVYKPVGAIALVIVLICGISVLGVGASKGSVPGDVLYKVKLTKENIQAGLTIDNGKKTDLYFSFADERLNEIDKIRKEPKETEEQTEQKENIKIAIKDFKKQIGSVKNQMEKAKTKPKPVKKVVEAAKNIDEKVEELSDKIDQQTKEEIESGDMEGVIAELAEAKEIIEETSDTAIGVIIEKYISGEVETPVEELVEKIEKKIQRAEEEVDKAQEDVDQLSENRDEADEADEADKFDEQKEESAETSVSTDDPEDASADSVSEEIEISAEESAQEESAKAFEEVIQKPDDAKRLVEEAKELLNQGDISNAFDKIMESKEITREVQETIENIEEDMVVNDSRENTAETENLEKDDETIDSNPAEESEESVDEQPSAEIAN